MELAQALGLNDIELIGDALDVIKQASRVLRDGHATAFLALATKDPPTRIGWITREQNLAGFALEARNNR